LFLFWTDIFLLGLSLAYDCSASKNVKGYSRVYLYRIQKFKFRDI